MLLYKLLMSLYIMGKTKCSTIGAYMYMCMLQCVYTIEWNVSLNITIQKYRGCSEIVPCIKKHTL